MKLIFLNMAGAWALLGVPALVIIHCLRVRARVLRIPAIFLVEKREEAAAGTKFSRWRPSPLFWVQLAAILLLSLLLMSPRLITADTRREVALVVDASVSMRAFRMEATSAAARLAGTLERDVARTHWLLATTDVGAPPLYVGEDREAMLRALSGYTPSLGAHDFTESLVAARRGLGAGGRVVLLTDHDMPEVPGGAELLSVGRPVANVGFSGGVFTGAGARRWRALVVNHSDASATRRWRVEYGEGQRTPESEITLGPRESVTLDGVAPAESFTVALDADAFSPDDRLPLVVPVPKPVLWRLSAPESLGRIVLPALRGLENASLAPAAGVSDIDLVCAKSRELPKGAAGARILFLDSEGEKTTPAKSPCFAPAPHPLTDGLAWGLVPSIGTNAFAARPDDRVLVRSGERALVILGRTGGADELIFNYDPRVVFAGEKLPAAAVLIRRFVETVRLAKDAPEALNTDCRSPLPTPPGTGALALRDAAGKITPLAAGATPRAPCEPGLFALLRGDVVKISGGAAFADTREADFSGAAPVEKLLAPEDASVRGEVTLDPLTLAGLLALLALLLISWRLAASRHAE
jgi:hypothetical protein